MARGNGASGVTVDKASLEKSGRTSVRVTHFDRGYIEIPIVGTSPYVPHCHSQEDLDRMERQRMGLPVEDSKKVILDPFKKMFETLYILPGCEQKASKLQKLKCGESWDFFPYFGIPAVAFKSAMVRAAGNMGSKMVEKKSQFFVKGIYGHWRHHLVPIESYSLAVMRRDPKSLGPGSMDLRYRMQFIDWSVTLKITYTLCKDMNPNQLLTIANNAGVVGVGDERPGTKSAAGMEWGIFEVKV